MRLDRPTLALQGRQHRWSCWCRHQSLWACSGIGRRDRQDRCRATWCVSPHHNCTWTIGRCHSHLWGCFCQWRACVSDRTWLRFHLSTTASCPCGQDRQRTAESCSACGWSTFRSDHYKSMLVQGLNYLCSIGRTQASWPKFRAISWKSLRKSSGISRWRFDHCLVQIWSWQGVRTSRDKFRGSQRDTWNGIHHLFGKDCQPSFGWGAESIDQWVLLALRFLSASNIGPPGFLWWNERSKLDKAERGLWSNMLDRTVDQIYADLTWKEQTVLHKGTCLYLDLDMPPFESAFDNDALVSKIVV